MAMWWTKQGETITVPLADWLALVDRAQATEARRILGDGPVPTVAQQATQPRRWLSTDEIELLLREHYRAVLSSPEGRKLWRRLLADASAAHRLGQLT